MVSRKTTPAPRLPPSAPADEISGRSRQDTRRARVQQVTADDEAEGKSDASDDGKDEVSVSEYEDEGDSDDEASDEDRATTRPKKKARVSSVATRATARKKQRASTDAVIAKAKAKVAQQKKTPRAKRSQADQPKWTDEEKDALVEIGRDGRELGWEYTKCYEAFREFCAQQSPPWPNRKDEGCRNIRKRMRDGGDATVPWNVAEMEFVNRLRSGGMRAPDIWREHTTRFKPEGRERTQTAVVRKLQMLPPWDPTVPLPAEASAVRRVTKQSVAPEGKARASLSIGSKALWTRDEDKVLKQFMRNATVDLGVIQKELKKQAQVTRTLNVVRTRQAIESRLSRLKEEAAAVEADRRRRLKPRRYTKFVPWGDAHNTIVKQVIQTGLSRDKAVLQIVQKTGVYKTDALKVWQKLKREARAQGAPGGDVGDERDEESPAEEDFDADEYADVQPQPPDAWNESDHFPSDMSGNESGGHSDEDESPSQLRSRQEGELTSRSSSPPSQVTELMEHLIATTERNESATSVILEDVQSHQQTDDRSLMVEDLPVCAEDDEYDTGFEVVQEEVSDPDEDNHVQQVNSPSTLVLSDLETEVQEALPIAMDEYGGKQPINPELTRGPTIQLDRKSDVEQPDQDMEDDELEKRPSSPPIRDDQSADITGEASGVAEPRSDDEEETPVRTRAVPMSPPRAAADETLDPIVESRVSQFFLTVPDGPSKAPLTYENRHKAWGGDNTAQTRTYSEFCSLRDQHRRRAFYFFGQSEKTPRVEDRDLKPLLFGVTLLLRDEVPLLVLLRELWDDAYAHHDVKCCLAYDATDPSFEFGGACRHWMYLHRRRVYLDHFEDPGDYLLAMALSVHRDAFLSTLGEYKVPEVGWTYHKFKIRGCGMASEMLHQWDTETTRVRHVTPVFGLLTGVVLETPSAYVKLHPTEAKWRTWDHGEVYEKRHKTRVLLGWAFVVNLRYTWVMFTTIPDDQIMNNRDRLEWCQKGNVANYVRRFAMIDYHVHNPCWIIARLSTRVCYQRELSRLIQLQAISTEAYQDVAGALSTTQLEVVTQALTRRGILLARGPYGCGKTTLIAHLVHAYRAAFPHKRIAIVSEANAAIEEDLARLIDMGFAKPGEVIRLGVPTTGSRAPFVPPDDRRGVYLHFCSKDRREKLKRERPDMSKLQIAQEIDAYEAQVLRDTPIVIATLSQLGKESFSKLQFHLVINDEAAQTLEGSLLQALRENTELLVLTGDPAQLWPFSPINDRERHRFVGDDQQHKLVWSLPQALTYAEMRRRGEDAEFPGVTMTAEFRSHPRITSFLAPFYDYALEDRARRSTAYLEGLQLPTCRCHDSWIAGRRTTKGQEVAPVLNGERVVWMSPTKSVCRAQENAQANPNAPESKTPEAKNLFNHVEAVAVVDLLVRLCMHFAGENRAGRYERKSILVISPYHSQVRSIQSKIEALKGIFDEWFDLEVRTTDSSQGKEAEFTIVSLVRNVALGFMENYPARSLVSLSRGRDYLFVFACHTVFRHDPTWRDVMENADEIEVPCYELEWTPREATARIDEIATWGRRELRLRRHADEEAQDQD